MGLSFGAWSSGGNGSLQLKTLGFSAPTDGAFFHSIRSTSGGRIFLLSGAPQIYELCYSSSEGWFRSKCRLVRHCVGLGWTERDRTGPKGLTRNEQEIACPEHLV